MHSGRRCAVRHEAAVPPIAEYSRSGGEHPGTTVPVPRVAEYSRSAEERLGTIAPLTRCGLRATRSSGGLTASSPPSHWIAGEQSHSGGSHREPVVEKPYDRSSSGFLDARQSLRYSLIHLRQRIGRDLSHNSCFA